MRFVSWNVNGFRAVLQKEFDESFIKLNADFFALQETKMQPGQADYDPPGYEDFWHSAQRKGYSGTAVFTKHEPLSIDYGLDGAHTDEGRVITMEYPDFYFVTAYVPNAQPGLVRIGYREQFEDAMLAHLKALDQKKPVIYCGDLNVAHNEIDLKYPRQNRGQPGFSDQERAKFNVLLDAGFTDTFRYLYPDKKEAYTWWSYRTNARATNAGWRIDYFLVSNRVADKIKAATIEDQIYGSDHCPVTLEIDL